MKKMICLLVCLAFLPACSAAEKTVELPGSRYVIDVPDRMEYSPAALPTDMGVEAYISEDLEMDYRSYPKTEAATFGISGTLRETAEQLVNLGVEAELREVGGIEMLVYRTQDPADGAPCIGYVFEDGGMLVEVFFWYATQEAADDTARIISSIREK